MTQSDTPVTRAERTRAMHCLHRTIRGAVDALSAPQQVALHAFKASVADEMDKLYLQIPAETADPILDNYFRDPPESAAKDRLEQMRASAAQAGVNAN